MIICFIPVALMSDLEVIWKGEIGHSLGLMGQGNLQFFTLSFQ